MFETAIRRASRVVLATTALASMILLGCTQAEPEVPSAGDAADDEVVVRSVTQQDVLDLVASDAPGTLLDVRSVAEFDSGHVPGALNIPVDELPQRLGELESGRAEEVIVYCAGGVVDGACVLRDPDDGAVATEHLRLEAGHRAARPHQVHEFLAPQRIGTGTHRSRGCEICEKPNRTDVVGIQIDRFSREILGSEYEELRRQRVVIDAPSTVIARMPSAK